MDQSVDWSVGWLVEREGGCKQNEYLYGTYTCYLKCGFNSGGHLALNRIRW